MTAGLLLLTLLQGAAAAAPPAPVVSQVLAAQVMLDRAGFSPGEIDGREGPNVRRATTAFQQSEQLDPSGAIDDATWRRLLERTGGAPPLISYTTDAADIAGPFIGELPRDLMAQAKLEALGYGSALEALAERFHSSPRLLRELNQHATFSAPGESLFVPNAGTALPPLLADDMLIVVTRRTSALTIEDASGRVVFHAPVTSGSDHDPLPIGSWTVTTVQRNPKFHYNPDLFWDADPGHSKATIPAGPNNPVGVVWIDLSKEHYGIHGTPEPSTVGHTQSHGCVRLTNWDALRVAQWAWPGTRVEFRE
ncbi:MAG: L,D-transpeptidase family protein [Vicinamibacterales bacterium]